MQSFPGRLDTIQRGSGPTAALTAASGQSLRAPNAAEKAQILKSISDVHAAWNDFASSPAVRAANVMALLHPDYSIWNGSLGMAGVLSNAAAVNKYFVGLMSGPVGKAVYNVSPFDIQVTSDGSMAIMREEATFKGPNIDVKLFATCVLAKGADGKLAPISKFSMYAPAPAQQSGKAT